MIKIINYFLIIFFITSIGYASHQHQSDKTSKNIEAKDLKEKDLKSKYCTINVEEKKEPKVEIVIQKNENGEEIQKEIQVINEYFVVKSFHTEKTSPAPKNLDFKILTKKIKKITYIGSQTPIKELLSFYCIQEKPKEGKSKKFKPIKKKDNSELAKLYNQIAVINGLADMNSEIGDELRKKGSLSLSIEDTNLVWSKAQFIIDEEKRLNEVRKQKEAEEAQKEAEKKANEDWLTKNKQPFIEKILDKQKEYKDEIKSLEKERSDIASLLETFIEKYEEAEISLRKAANFDNSTQEIKQLKNDLTEAGFKYLKDTHIKNFKDEFYIIDGIDFTKKYNNFLKINELLKKVEKSNKKKEFKGYKSLLGKKYIGFEKEFENIKDQKLGSHREREDMGKLKKEINSKISDINLNILDPFEKLVELDEIHSSQLPIKEIIIGIIVFIIVIGVIAYIYFNNKKLRQLQEESDKKVGSLKSDFEGKLKDTSDQIKSVGLRDNNAKNQNIENKAVEEKPKTPEQIIAIKYDEMVSDYNDALDDFSKVATFKQKWSGVALSRKERQEGSKTILIASSRAFEKAEIWCLSFDGKFFAFPGSTVKSNMATYMNLDFEKASRDFKGVLSVTTGSNYSTEPAVLRKGGAGYVVERTGKISFPS